MGVIYLYCLIVSIQLGLSELTEVGESFISLGEIVAPSAESLKDPMDEDKKPIDK